MESCRSAAGLRFARAWEAADPALRKALSAAGVATAAGVAYLTDGTWEDAQSAARSLAEGKAEDILVAQWAGELQLLQDAARGATAADCARFARRAHEDLAAEAEVLLRASGGPLEIATRAETQKRMLSYAPAPPAVRARRLSADADPVGGEGPNARAEAEEARRRVQVAALAELLREAEAPVVLVAEGSAHPERVLAAAAGGRRARTLEKWLGVWRRYRAWLLDTTGQVFPRRPGDLIDYMIVRADEPCGRSTLLAVRGLFQVMEEMAGVEPAARLSSLPSVVSIGEDLLAGVQQRVRRGGGEAPRYTRAHVVALEKVVVDVDSPLYHRLYAFWKLLSVWGTLRFDDHRGCGTGALRMSARGLEGCLTRTKTTGRGKRVAHRPLLVSREAFVQEGGWLATGWVLWAAWAPDHRDYFLRPPTAGYAGLEPREITYTQAAAATRALHRHLPGPGGRCLLPSAQAAAYWTEHTPRNFLPSAAALMEFPSEWIDGLGCWSPTGSKAYIRTVQARAKIMQDRVAASLQGSGAAEFFDDGSVIEGLVTHLAALGATEEEADLQRGLLAVACAEELEPEVPVSRNMADDSDNATVVPSPSEPSSDAEGTGGCEALSDEHGDRARGTGAMFGQPAPEVLVGNPQRLLLPLSREASGGSRACPSDYTTDRDRVGAAVPEYDQMDVLGWPSGIRGPAIAGARTCSVSRARGSTMRGNVEGRSVGGESSRARGLRDQMDAEARASDLLEAGGTTMPSNVEALRAQNSPGGDEDLLGTAFEWTESLPEGREWQVQEEQDDEELGAERLEVAPVAPPLEVAAAEELLREASAVVEKAPEEADYETPAGEQGYVVSLGKRDWRRLHYIGGCSRLPGVHYLRFEFLGAERPSPEQCDDVCRQCWGAKGRAPALEDDAGLLVGELSPETSEAEEP